jgi:hypothetical protein
MPSGHQGFNYFYVHIRRTDRDAILEGVERLLRGDFTEDEFQNLCHRFQDADAERFSQGCVDYMTKLFGHCPLTDTWPRHAPAKGETVGQRWDGKSRPWVIALSKVLPAKDMVVHFVGDEASFVINWEDDGLIGSVNLTQSHPTKAAAEAARAGGK